MKKICDTVDSQCRQAIRLDRPHPTQRADRDSSIRGAVSGGPVLRLSGLCDVLRFGPVPSANSSVYGIARATKSGDAIWSIKLIEIAEASPETSKKLPARRRSQLLVDRDQPSGDGPVKSANSLNCLSAAPFTTFSAVFALFVPFPLPLFGRRVGELSSTLLEELLWSRGTLIR